MPKGVFRYQVEYENGTTKTVTAGQRELAAFELAHEISAFEGTRRMPNVFYRFIAYTALANQRRLPTVGVGADARQQTLEEWDALVAEVIDATDDAPGEADPTPPDQPPAD